MTIRQQWLVVLGVVALLGGGLVAATRYMGDELFPVSETHFLMPSDDPLEDTQTLAIYDFHNGHAQYLHTNCRVNPRVS